MHHVLPISKRRPGTAQLEPISQLIGIISALLALIEQASELFGFELPRKGDQ